MQVLFNISDEEFGIDIANKFQDFFKRLRAEINAHMISGTNLVCGAYELETINMFLEAFEKSSILPKGHGNLIDINNIDVIELEDSAHIIRHEKGDEVDVYISAPIIIEADRSNT